MSSKDSSADADTKKKRPAEQAPEPASNSKAQRPLRTLPQEVENIAQRVVMKESRTIANISVSQAAETKFLCMITNDVKGDHTRLQEAGSNPNMVPVQLAILQCLKPTGYHAAPYENAKDVAPKLRQYTDENGKPKDKFKPVLLAAPERGEIVDGGPVLNIIKFRSFEKHPNKGLQTKTRGVPTEVVGALFEGLSLGMKIFDDRCAITSALGSGIDGLRQYALAIVGMKIRNREQCENGYGLTVSSIEVPHGLDASMAGFYPDSSLYTPYSPIGDQTNAFFQKRKWSAVLDSDLKFVMQSLRRADKPDMVQEKPLVVLHSRGEVTIASNNAQLHLKMDDERSIYHGKVLDVVVPSGAFSERTRKSGLVWLQGFYNWCLAANACDVVVVHDDYRWRQQDSARGLACFIVPKNSRIFASMKTEPLILNESQSASLNQASGATFNLDEVRDDGTPRYAAWVVGAEKRAAIVMDLAAVKTAKQSAGSEPTDTAHSSLFCQIYPGMNPQRGVYLSYLVTLKGGAVKSALMTGIQAVNCQEPEVADDAASMIQMPANVNIDDVF